MKFSKVSLNPPPRAVVARLDEHLRALTKNFYVIKLSDELPPFGVLHSDQIAKMAGYSRVRIYDFAVKGRIPGEPLRKPPEGQYRFEDTPALRSWCKKLRKNKPKAQPRRQASPRSASGRAARAEWEMRAVLKSGKADKKDLENALSLLESCRRLAYVPVFKEQPCTRGVLGIMAHFLMRSYNSRCENLLQMTNIHGALLEMLEAEKARTLPS